MLLPHRGIIPPDTNVGASDDGSRAPDCVEKSEGQKHGRIFDVKRSRLYMENEKQFDCYDSAKGTEDRGVGVIGGADAYA